MRTTLDPVGYPELYRINSRRVTLSQPVDPGNESRADASSRKEVS